MRRISGFTLIELIVTLAVAAILVGLVAPSFQNLMRNNQVTTETNSLLSAFQLARSEAVRRGGPVSILNEPGGFGNGWCVIAAALGGVDCDDAAVIRRFPATNGVSVSQGALTGVTFDERGYQAAPGTDVSIEFEPLDCAPGSTRMRRVSVSPAGRATVILDDCT
ncbi:hypothetical protein BG841_09460 [Marinobacter sp. X15-166B]|nr:hypothetical protein BG841_09460 [Marinobacter sp. X15-166B]